jgi:hypothetical protein
VQRCAFFLLDRAAKRSHEKHCQVFEIVTSRLSGTFGPSKQVNDSGVEPSLSLHLRCPAVFQPQLSRALDNWKQPVCFFFFFSFPTASFFFFFF